MELTIIEVAGLEPGEVAYQTATGDVVAVAIAPRPVDPEFVCFGVWARVLDGAGGTCQCPVTGAQMHAPENRVTIPLDAIAHGRVTIEGEVERARAEAVARALRVKAALACTAVLTGGVS